MKFKIEKKILLEHLNYVIKGVSSKNIIPILGCIKFELKNEGLYLMSTDNEIAIKDFIDKKDIELIDTLGEIVISGKYIYEIIRKLDDTIVNIEELIDSQILINTDKSKFKLNCNKVSEFPDLDLEFIKNPIIMNQNNFRNAINQTIFATSNQESRPILTGINIKIKNNKFQCTATDSYRLARKVIELNDSVKEDIDIIVPSRNLLEVIKLLNNDEDNFEIHIFNNKIIFKINEIIIMSRLINGNYPETDKLIMNEFELSVKLNLNELYNAINRASLLTNEEEKNIINFEINEDNVIISSNIPEIGNVEEKLTINPSEDSKPIKISFSSKFMLEALKIFECEEVELKFNGDVKPFIIKDSLDENLIQLIVPIRTY